MWGTLSLFQQRRSSPRPSARSEPRHKPCLRWDVYSCASDAALVAAVPAKTAAAKIIAAVPPRDTFNIQKSFRFARAFALGALRGGKRFPECGERTETEVKASTNGHDGPVMALMPVINRSAAGHRRVELKHAKLSSDTDAPVGMGLTRLPIIGRAQISKHSNMAAQPPFRQRLETGLDLAVEGRLPRGAIIRRIIEPGRDRPDIRSGIDFRIFEVDAAGICGSDSANDAAIEGQVLVIRLA